MLEPIRHILSTKRIILASSSPRRKQILSNIGLDFEIIPSTFEENLDKSKFKYPHEFVIETAKHKALQVASEEKKTPDLVIGADTVVTVGDKLLEKPKTKDEAYEMLSSFSGGSHTVVTGVVFVTPKSVINDKIPTEERFNITQFYEETRVEFAEMSSEVISAYIDTGEPMDKAGGFGIQEKGGTLVKSIKGDYFNVMGFPLYKFSKHLVELYGKT